MCFVRTRSHYRRSLEYIGIPGCHGSSLMTWTLNELETP